MSDPLWVTEQEVVRLIGLGEVIKALERKANCSGTT